MDEVELATQRRRRVSVGIALAVVLAIALFVLLPRTVASGGEGDGSWRLRITPVAVGPQIVLDHASGRQTAGDSGLGSTALDGTVVWHVGSGDEAVTVVAGATPGGATSVRVTSDEFGVGEAALHRIGWRRFHVERLPGHVEVTELVAIGPAGRVLEVLRDPPAPVPVP